MEFIMKSYIDKLFINITKLSLIAFFVFMQGCQQGDSAESDQEINKDTHLMSSRLSDNSISENTSFNNFKDTTIHFDPSPLAFNGDRLFLKINRDNKEVLYIGEINRYQLFRINIQIPLDDAQLYYEVFTNDINDITQFGVIEL